MEFARQLNLEIAIKKLGTTKKFVLWLVELGNIRNFNKLKFGWKLKLEVLTQPQYKFSAVRL